MTCYHNDKRKNIGKICFHVSIAGFYLAELVRLNYTINKMDSSGLVLEYKIKENEKESQYRMEFRIRSEQDKKDIKTLESLIPPSVRDEILDMNAEIEVKYGK